MWFRKDKAPRAPRDPKTTSSLGEGLFLKCEGCREALYVKEVERNLRVCPKCGFHFHLPAVERLRLLLGEGGGQPLFTEVRPSDPLKFKDSKRYRDRLKESEAKTGRPDLGEERLPASLPEQEFEALDRGHPEVIPALRAHAQVALHFLQVERLAATLAFQKEALAQRGRRLRVSRHPRGLVFSKPHGANRGS